MDCVFLKVPYGLCVSEGTRSALTGSFAETQHVLYPMAVCRDAAAIVVLYGLCVFEVCCTPVNNHISSKEPNTLSKLVPSAVQRDATAMFVPHGM